MSNIIPNTNSERVAAVAAALYLVDATHRSGTPDALEDRLQRFINAYDVIFGVIDNGKDNAQARLDRIKNPE